MKWSILNEILSSLELPVLVILEGAVGIATLIIELKVDEGILHGVQKHSGSRVSIQEPLWAPAVAFQHALPVLEAAPDSDTVPLPCQRLDLKENWKTHTLPNFVYLNSY